MQKQQIKEFGMNCLLVETNLANIERRFGIALGKEKSPLEKDSTYYPQFDEIIRNQATAMAKHYEIFYCIEQSIRGIIVQRFSEEHGVNWWDKDEEILTKGLSEEVTKRLQEEQHQHITPRSERMIDYTTFGELRGLIDKNWTLFNDIFKSPRALGKVFRDLIALRNQIAHCCPLTDDEVDRLSLCVRDWFRLME